jgi:hypothetical protein
MLVTERDATMKWCPFGSRVWGESTITGSCCGHNRDYHDKPTTLCLGSRCMAWNEKTIDGVVKGYCGLTR